MWLQDGTYECAQCGALLDLPLMENPKAVIRARSGQPNLWVLRYAGREVHRCEVSDKPPRFSRLEN